MTLTLRPFYGGVCPPQLMAIAAPIIPLFYRISL